MIKSLATASLKLIFILEIHKAGKNDNLTGTILSTFEV